MIVLGIESSCDETGVAVYDGTRQRLLANVLYSQTALHAEYGGVVPELASRDHMQRIGGLYRQALQQAALAPENVEAVAYTAGPGLVGALMVGASFARGLAFGLDIPGIGIHHLEGHLLAPFLATAEVSYPFVTLLVSGGHTQLIAVEGFGHYRLLGDTLDDAAGEAFDKTAKLLGLPYPGGPHLAALARQGRPGRYRLPRPLLKRPGCDFSFSGLKTAVLQAWHQAEEPGDQVKADLCLAFEEAVVETLVVKCLRALEQYQCRRLLVAGGVSANRRLRSALQQAADRRGIMLSFPPLAYCTDNGAMIALAGAWRLQHGCAERHQAIDVRARWPLYELTGHEDA